MGKIRLDEERFLLGLKDDDDDEIVKMVVVVIAE